jgi:carboxymethylenebutenolidase
MAEYLALPKGNERHPAVIVIHEWWGVNEQIKAIVDRWAALGFVALAPDLFHGHVVPIGKSAEAQAAMNKLDFTKAVDEIVAAVALLNGHPRSTGKVAVTGYCMGGALTMATACNVRGLAALVPFYGIPPGGDWSKIDAPVQAHFALHDDWATVDSAKTVQKAIADHGGKMELFTYDAHHAFCNDHRPEVYSATAAQQAWDRAVAFVRAHTA